MFSIGDQISVEEVFDTPEEIRSELGRYTGFLVQVAGGDYRLVIGFPAADPHYPAGPTVLYEAPAEPPPRQPAASCRAA